MTTNMVIGAEGLRVRQTAVTRDALRRASASEEVIDAETVPFRLLRDVAVALRDDAGDDSGPYLQDLVRGGGLALDPPKRPARDPALERRCLVLQEAQEAREYAAMTKDVTRERREVGIRMSEVTRDLGFGAHVVTLMGACFACGVVAGRSIAPDNVTVQVVLGAIGMFGALMVEALLFMLRDAKT
jgi:hypothetical protein